MSSKSWFTSSKALSFGVFILILIIYMALIPKGYRYDSDVRISPYGMAIIEGYLDHGMGACHGMPHFIENGKLQCYKNWPPLGFMTFALWVKIFGKTLFSARVLMVIISALSIFPVYEILRQFQPNRKPLVWGLTLLYGLLPYSILYSSMVYVDVFIPLFWASATLFYLRKKFKVLLITSLIGCLFHWMAIFPLLAFVFVQYFKKDTVISILFFFVIVQGSIGLMHEFVNAHVGLLNRLYEYSIWPSMNDPMLYGIRLATILLHFSPLIFLLFIVKLQNKTQSFTKRGLHKAIRFSIATYILMLSVFPQWILLHNHTIPFLSLIGIFGLLYGLRSCKIQYVSFAMVLGLALMISIVHSQVTIPKFAKDLSTKQARDLAFQKIISERYSGKDNQPTIFFVLGTQDAKNILSEPFAFKEKCDACIFTDDRILGHSVLSTTLESTNSTYNLSCDSENFYVITDWHDERITRLLNSRYSYDIVHREDGLILYHLKPQKAP